MDSFTMSEPELTPDPCPCCNHSMLSQSQPTDPTAIVIRTSEFDVSPKEIVILCLLLLLVIYSIWMFVNNWSRNYRDIYQPAFITYNANGEEEEGDETATSHHFATILSFEHDDDYSSRADSRMSKMSQVVKAKSVVEKSKKDGSITCSLVSDSFLSQQVQLRKTKSFSASNLFPKTRSPNLMLVRQAPVHSHLSSSRIRNVQSLDDEGLNNLHTPRISIDDTDSNDSSQPPPYRPYLKYHRRSNGHVLSAESDQSRDNSHSPHDVSCANSKSNLQIACNSREDGGSFSFSDLDPVQEDSED